jgi:hypothetical protein
VGSLGWRRGAGRAQGTPEHDREGETTGAGGRRWRHEARPHQACAYRTDVSGRAGVATRRPPAMRQGTARTGRDTGGLYRPWRDTCEPARPLVVPARRPHARPIRTDAGERAGDRPSPPPGCIGGGTGGWPRRR